MDKFLRKRSKSQNDLDLEGIDGVQDLSEKTSAKSRDVEEPIDIIVCNDLTPNSENRVRLIGELITLMNSKNASSVVELDKKLADCFNCYYKVAAPTSNPEIEHLFLTSHTKMKPIRPPKCLVKSTNVTSLDRFTKLERLFRSVPTFDNKDISIRDFLLELQTVVNDLGCNVTEGEFKYLLLNKIHPKIKTVLMASHSTSTLEGIYEHLLNIYDNTSSERDVFSSLVGSKQHFNSLKEYLEYTLKLLSTIKSTKESTNALLHNLKLHLPPRIYDKITDFSDRYEALKKETPPVERIINILYSNRDTIDKHFASKTPNKFNEVKLDIEKCGYCHKEGHNEKNCFKKSVCTKCNTMGHNANFCRQNKPVCAKCARVGHLTAECRARCRLCNALTHNSVHCPVYTNIEPAQAYCNKCYERINLKLYHPTHQCKNFLGAAKNSL